MTKTVALTGNIACAQAMRQINPDVVAAYPITPQTTIVEEYSNYVANGLVDTEYVTVESEHSALSACVGASAAGARVMTATSSQGLAYMWEVLYIAASLRLPIVMHNANRTLSGPINIHCDHQDSMGARDAGWIQLFSENAQEAYDNTIMAIRIAEDSRVMLPVMVCLDGFIISHSIERLDMLEDEEVKRFVGDYEPVNHLLDVNHPVSVGPFDSLHGYFYEFKKVQDKAILESTKVIEEIGKEYEQLSGRAYGLLESYRDDDADVLILLLGSTAGTARDAVDMARERGIKAGSVKLRCFRPFPAAELLQVLGKAKAVAVMDRSLSFGGEGGPLFTETRSALYDASSKPHLVDYVYGLGGRDIVAEDIVDVYTRLQEIAASGNVGQTVTHIGVRA